jgi:AraC-like DNA-binding protein
MNHSPGGIPKYKLESDHLMETPFVIKRMEDIDDAAQDQDEKAHRHEYYVILWLEKGAGTHFIDFAEYPLQPNSIFFISPAQIHLVKPSEKPFGTAILFKPEFLHFIGLSESQLVESGIFHDFDHSPVLLAEENIATIKHLIEQLFDLQKSKNLDLIAAYMKVFLLRCMELKTDAQNDFQENSRAQNIVCDFRKLIDNTFQEKHKVADYAEAMHLTPNHLNEVIKKNTGKTAKEHIQTRLLMEAQRNALHTDCTLQEITYHLGFKDPAHFSKFFKKQSGLTFQEYRKKVRHIYQ